MHAARGGDKHVFRQVWGRYRRCVPDWRTTRWFSADTTGRTVLHHAAEAGSLDVLRAVISLLEDSVRDENIAEEVKEEMNPADMNRADKNGRTPIMHLLRYGGRRRRQALRTVRKLCKDAQHEDHRSPLT